MEKFLMNALKIRIVMAGHLYQLFAVVVGCFCMLGCSHVYYVPPAQNVPLFKEKNEVRIAANYSQDVGKEFDIQAAYSITERFAIMTNFCSVADDVSEPQQSYGEGNYFDAAFGFYKPLDRNWVFEIYGGIGTSNQKHRYMDYNEPVSTAELSFISFFLQPNIGFTSKAFDVAVATRLSNITFHSIKDNRVSIQNEYDALSRISANKNSFLIEPSLTLRVGWKYVKLQAQGLYSKHLSNQYLGFHDYRASLGLSFAFAERFKNKK